MKQIIMLMLLLILTSAKRNQSNENCYPDKGIKIAITTAEIRYENSSKKKKLDKTQKIEYNKDGQLSIIFDAKDASEHRREYKEGKLQHIITTQKNLPDFYDSNQLDSLIANSENQTDTAFIMSHHQDGRPFEMKDSDGMTWVFEYNNCDEELITTLYPNGDTLQQVRNKNKDGVLVESIWTPFQPIKSYVKTDYYRYKFNKHGHWIKRTYEIREGIVTEKRTLTYY